MTDLVFLLLIFFVVLSTLVSSGHNIDLPNGSGDTTSKGLVVAVNANNVIMVGDSKSPVQVKDLEKVILNNLTDNKTVELEGDKNCDWDYAVQVINIAKKNKLKIVIKTKHG